MKKNKSVKQNATKTLAELYNTINQIQREEFDMPENTNSYSHLNTLYQHFSLLQSRMSKEVGPHRARLFIQSKANRG